MGMLITTLGFLGLTAIAMFFHMRSRPASGPANAATPAGPPCPRCGTRAPAEAAFCPGCGVPRQIYEYVAAPVANGNGAGADAGEKLHAVVRADMCVGCGTCVEVCPEPGAIRLLGKLSIVDKSLCVGHGKCATACPVGAIVLTTGASVHRVEVPEVDSNFESSVLGVHIVGELGGRGLIKNAINEGKIAAEHVARMLPPGKPRADGDRDAYDVIVVGSGPAGLSAGLEALRSGLRCVVLEQGSLADSVQKYPRHKILFAEPVRVPIYGDLWIADGSKEALLKVWETVIANTGLEVMTGQQVENVVRRGSMLIITASGRELRARRVVLAMGRRGTPRRLGVPGEELNKVFYNIVEMEAFAGRRMLVVGGGDSAVESALGLANQPGTTVTISYRGEQLTRIKDRNRVKFDAAVASRRFEVLFESTVKEIREGVVVLEHQGGPRILPNDDVVVRIGGDPPYEFLKRIGVRIVQKEVPLPEASVAALG